MIVRQLKNIVGSEQEIEASNWISRRFLLKKDGMGFSLHDTMIKAGTETHMWYRNHLEAVYCIEGRGEVETLEDSQVYPIQPGTMYALDRNDRHCLRATTDMRMICVFNPPLNGAEVHDESGAYPCAEKSSEC